MGSKITILGPTVDKESDRLKTQQNTKYHIKKIYFAKYHLLSTELAFF